MELVKQLLFSSDVRQRDLDSHFSSDFAVSNLAHRPRAAHCALAAFAASVGVSGVTRDPEHRSWTL